MIGKYFVNESEEENLEKDIEFMINTENGLDLEMSPIYPNMTLLDELAMTYFNYKRDGKKTIPISLPPVNFINDLLNSNAINRPNVKLESFKGVLIHSTANRNRGATARNNVKYTKGLKVKNSYHCCIDNNECVSIIPWNEKTYSTGSTVANNNYIAIEVAENGTDKESTTRQLTTTWVYAAQLTAFLLYNYSKIPIGKKASDYVITHAYVNQVMIRPPKSKICPNNVLLHKIPFSFTTFCHLVDLFFIP